MKNNEAIKPQKALKRFLSVPAVDDETKGPRANTEGCHSTCEDMI